MIKDYLMRHINLWKFLRLIAITALALIIYQVKEEAFPLSQEIIWVKDKFLVLTWNPPVDGSHHYRVEISKTDLLAVPVTTSLFYEYTKSNEFEIELLDNHSYSFRVQAVTPYGALSGFSDKSPIYIFDGMATSINERLTSDTPSEFSLSQNYPNPFNNRTTIEYQIPHSGMDRNIVRVHLTIYNILGQRVKELINENQAPGRYSVSWDVTDDNGHEVASGYYIYQLIAGNRQLSRKMIYIK